MTAWNLSAWNLTMLTVHVAAMYGCVCLFDRTPDGMQKLVIAMVTIAAWFMVFAYSLAIVGDVKSESSWRWWAQEVEHLGVLLYIFRLVITEKILCRIQP